MYSMEFLFHKVVFKAVGTAFMLTVQHLRLLCATLFQMIIIFASVCII